MGQFTKEDKVLAAKEFLRDAEKMFNGTEKEMAEMREQCSDDIHDWFEDAMNVIKSLVEG